jgi:hypothetical protein
MKKTLNLLVLSLLVLSLGLATAQACTTPGCVIETTGVGGIIYQNEITNVISDADVTVTCNHNGVDYSGVTTSQSNGEYGYLFDASECGYGDSVTVDAVKAGLMGTNDGDITMTNTIVMNKSCKFKLNVGIVNVPMVPEFGVFAGALTLLSAVGIFFFVRRK